MNHTQASCKTNTHTHFHSKHKLKHKQLETHSNAKDGHVSDLVSTRGMCPFTHHCLFSSALANQQMTLHALIMHPSTDRSSCGCHLLWVHDIHQRLSHGHGLDALEVKAVHVVPVLNLVRLHAISSSSSTDAQWTLHVECSGVQPRRRTARLTLCCCACSHSCSGE